ncbi:DinB family protein [Glaciecola sp. MH2013]|uniref:DinB family protein n=1 Tax=Glaciecola sp. MH2013 TaxID=2785524 RepID=UPI00189FD763|nr:DinB family protein [Glaciecola sp. MH2013]MBF7074071.1 DinB family protein [Glaciecola sp. MH2013]
MSNSYVDVVEQAISLLDDISLSDYQSALKPHFSSSIGAHIRHIVDHFTAIVDGYEAGEINYNKRNRHGDVEQFPQKAIASLESVSEWLLTTCSSELLNKKVYVTTEIDISHTKSTTCESTLERELVFAASHAIHHYALIRIIRNMQGKDLPEFFGYAPATITHLNRSA